MFEGVDGGDAELRGDSGGPTNPVFDRLHSSHYSRRTVDHTAHGDTGDISESESEGNAGLRSLQDVLNNQGPGGDSDDEDPPESGSARDSQGSRGARPASARGRSRSVSVRSTPSGTQLTQNCQYPTKSMLRICKLTYSRLSFLG